MKVGENVKKRLIKKIVKQMTDSELFECVAYESNKRWLYIAEIEFEKRLRRNSIAWKETPKGYKTIQFEETPRNTYLYSTTELACIHEEKDFHKDTLLLSLPPKIKWTCEKCGKIGYETVGK